MYTHTDTHTLLWPNGSWCITEEASALEGMTHTLDSGRLRVAFYGFRTLGHDPDQKAGAIIGVRVRPRFHLFFVFP